MLDLAFYRRLVAESSTPFYVIDLDAIGLLLEGFRRSFRSRWPNLLVGYSFKTNSLPFLLGWFKQQGLCAEVVSADEYRLAKLLGFKQVIFGGPWKGASELIHAAERKAILNIDTFAEIEQLEQARRPGEPPWKVGLRVNFDLEAACPGESAMGREVGRFGLCCESGELANAIERIRSSSSLHLAGLHLHQSSRTRSLGIYTALARKAVELQNRYKLDLEYLDIGGGFFGGMPDRPSFAHYAEAICSTLRRAFSPDKTALILEPGIALVGSPVSYVTRVVSTKMVRGRSIATLDGSALHVNPFLRQRGLRIRASASQPARTASKQVLAGCTCMEDDRFEAAKPLGLLQTGDFLIVDKVGGYTMTYNSFFIQYLPRVFAVEKGQVSLVREHFSPLQYLRNTRNR
jgi:diaminopimelate decarboxylase